MKRFFCLLVLAGLGFGAFSQKTLAQSAGDDAVLLIVGRDTTTRGDFMKAYRQNLSPEEKSVKPSREELQDYMELYTNFRLKVMDARDSRYDTMSALSSELNIYRQQLAKPYIMDVEMMENMEKEAMEYIKYDIFARHVLVSVPLFPTPEDTMQAYKKICMVREKLMNGENFADVAYEYSDDVKPDRFGNKIKTGKEGEMGYFTVLSMQYPIERAVYNMKIGELSQPIRTRYGYHVVQLLDKKPALGKVTLAHILVPVNPKKATEEAEAEAKAWIDSAYKKLEEGVSFGEVAKEYSFDKQTGARGGYMGSFAVNRMLPEVIAQLYPLRQGEYTKPFRSRFGWQIVMLMEKTGVPSEGDALELIRYGIENGMDRGALPYKSFINEKLKTAKWKWNDKTVENLRKYYRSLPSLKSIGRDSMENPKLFNQVILTYEGQNHTVWEFIHLADKNTPNAKQVTNTAVWFSAMQEEFLHNAAVKYELSTLDNKYPEFKQLMGEYRDGVYLFEINNRKVWAKALTDSAGLDAFFRANSQKYYCPEMLAGTLLTYDVTKGVKTKDVEKLAQKAIAKNMTVAQLQAEAAKKFGANRIKIDSTLFSPGDNRFVDNAPRQVGLSKNLLSGGQEKAYMIVTEIYPRRPYELEEVKGMVMNDYQAYLETEWIKELRGKYKITVDRDVFESLFK